MPAHDRYDVLIAGARCAGASTAMLLARAGARVLVVDPLPRGRDTLSTHALMRGGLTQLHRWGLLERLVASGAPAIHTVLFDYGDEVVPVALRDRHGVDALRGPRRTVLDALLSDAAEEAGAEIVRGHRVQGLARDPDGRVRGAWIGDAESATLVEAGEVVGADGIRSDVARLVEAPLLRSTSTASATVYGYFGGFPDDVVRWSFRPGLGTGVIPTHDGQACVFAAFPPERLEAAGRRGMEAVFLDALDRVDPEAAAVVRSAPRPRRLRGFPGLPGHLKAPMGPGWALVGDAGFFRDPFTAHGISDAFRDAELLARALTAGRHGDYASVRDPLALELLEVSARIAAFDWTMDELKAYHARLNRAMNASLEACLELDEATTVAA